MTFHSIVVDDNGVHINVDVWKPGLVNISIVAYLPQIFGCYYLYYFYRPNVVIALGEKKL